MIRQNLACDVPAQDVVYFSLNFTKGLRYGERTIFGFCGWIWEGEGKWITLKDTSALVQSKWNLLTQKSQTIW